MKIEPNLKKTLLSLLIGTIFSPHMAIATPLDFSQLPPGKLTVPPTPNVILSVDDSGSMDEKVGGGDNKKKIFRLKEALTQVFNDKLLLPDGKIRLAWQAMWNNGNAATAGTLTAGNTNSMKVLDETHRTNFLAFTNSLSANNGTPSHKMMLQTYNYMKVGKTINSPWASVPGTTELPYLGCRRSYHIFMTDGAWNGYETNQLPGEVDNVSYELPDTDKTIYDVTSPQTNVYRGSQKNLLADWAMKMWQEDLQPDIPNQLKPSTTDGVISEEPVTSSSGKTTLLKRYWNPKHNPATWQHLVQYTIGYGEDAYSWPSAPKWSTADDDNYGSGGDYAKLVNGEVSWAPTVMQNLNANNPAELWHMAINSRGKFYPTGPGRKYSLQDAFRKIIENINLENTADVASMSSSSTTNIRSDVNRYVAGFEPKKWSGYIRADRINTTGEYSAEPGWGTNAGAVAPNDRKTTGQKLDALTGITDRVILTTNDATNKGVSFEWATNTTKLSATQKALLDGGSLGSDRVNFIRGERTKEGGISGSPFRVRDSRQGDIINSNVWYLSNPASNFNFKGYLNFSKAHSKRLPMVYVGGNDGMLHGFSAVDGSEQIAYIPKGVIANLEQLSRPDYAHKYYVDGSPFSGDVDTADRSAPTYTPDWRTMLVGTLGAGGKGYFVLDVTQPGTTDAAVSSTFTAGNANSLVVMDKTMNPNITTSSDDEDIGHIFAPPVLDDTNPYKTSQIALLNNERWAVILGNGYNSTKERPVLLIQYLDGDKELKKIVATETQTVSNPVNPVLDTNVLANGLSAPRLVDINSDGKADLVYAGDLKGNLWKFDLTSKAASDWGVSFNGKPLYTATYVDGVNQTRQPISSQPIVKANDRGAGGMMVAFGTGVNITDTDRNSTKTQSVYSVLDNTKYKIVEKIVKIDTDTTKNGATPMPVSGITELVNQLPGSAEIKGSGVSSDRTFWTMSQNGVNYTDTTKTLKKGWYLNLPVTGERVLKPISFFDGSNNLMVYSQVPSYGGQITQAESCEASATEEKQYLTLLNIMDGKKPSVQVMDTNGDGLYNSTTDKGASRMDLPPGVISSVVGKKTNALTAGNGGKKIELARMPEQSMRPSWRQLQ